MIFTTALLAAILAISCESTNTNGPATARTTRPSGKAVPIDQLPKINLVRVKGSLNPSKTAKVTPESRQTTPAKPSAGTKPQRPRFTPPLLFQKDLEAPALLPIKSIKTLGKYSNKELFKAQRRFDDMESATLENDLIQTNLFAGLIEKAKKKFAKNPKWPRDHLRDYIRKKVAGQLSQMEKKYGKDFAEEILIRAMLDKGF